MLYRMVLKLFLHKGRPDQLWFLQTGGKNADHHRAALNSRVARLSNNKVPYTQRPLATCSTIVKQVSGTSSYIIEAVLHS